METLRRLMFGGGAVNGGAAPFPDEAQGGGGGGGGSGVAGGAGGGGARGVDTAESGGAAEPGLGPTRHVYTTSEGRVVEIREVWADNLDEEMAVIREVVEQYPYVAMDTEFPGVVARPIGDFMAQDYQYKTLKCNVDLLKIIQLGLSFADDKGRSPDSCQSWQFNFSFSLKDDIYADDSIELLKKSGIDFLKHERHGIDVHHFGELLMTSGLVLLDNVRWISFHSGYDFAYLLKVLTCQALPSDEGQFFEVLRVYFPCFYDIKYLITACQTYHGGLQKIAEDLKVERVGPMHQAGSDSLLTLHTFFKLLEQPPFNGSVSDDKFKCELFGLGHNHTAIRNYNPAMNNYATKMNGGLRESRERADFNATNKDTGATGTIGTPREREATPIQHSDSLSVSATGLGSPGLNAVGGPAGNNTNTPPGEELTFLLPEQYSNATQADGTAGHATGDGAAQPGGGS